MSQEDTITAAEAQEAVNNGDTVNEDELQEIHKDLRPEQIAAKIALENAELEMKESKPYKKPRKAARQGRKTYNTGPKGVLTDYEEAKLVMRANRLKDKIKAKNKMYININNADDINGFKLINNNGKQIDIDNMEYELGLNNSDDSDDELTRLDKMQRMEIKYRYLPRFGDTREITYGNFNTEIDEAPKGVWCVLHVYQDVCGIYICVYIRI